MNEPERRPDEAENGLTVADVWAAFRAVPYQGTSGSLSAVVYINLGKLGMFLDQGGLAILFSGVGTVGRTSTIDAAEDIIRAIAAQEDIDPTASVFYDLETYKGYENMKPGQCLLNRIGFDVHNGDVCNVSWHSVTLPSGFMDIFYPLVGHCLTETQ